MAQDPATPQLGKELFRKPLVLGLLDPLSGKSLLVLGCGSGSGYWCRELARRGARVTGVDEGNQQLELARAEEARRPLGIRYLERRIGQLGGLEDGEFELVFLDYVLLSIPRLELIARLFFEAHRVLADDGRMLVSELHPFDALLDDAMVLPSGFHYFSRGAAFEARGRQLDGKTVQYTNYHWTVSDYYEAITRAGFYVSRILEPQVSRSLLEANPELQYRANLPRDLIFMAEK
ncbi:class I SAM-dependent methyltransferase [Paraliomyxa miuraensis]|uniref:class I SAM-dependent methyltransferase n=1 Tax=Paraliomyxa miuraensis TaxID=376150 RepID=UPI0022543E98|nr:class I SAM-dependent methyltransferase [Paraliomyxa miuraensis]MCX4247826.1 methyltransferase domain-containing protein [Paraliomyxa miuraensis]